MQLDDLPIGPEVAVLAGVTLLLGVLWLIVLVRRRSALATQAGSGVVEADEGSEAADPADLEEPAIQTAEHDLSPRALAAYVRTLEETLAEQDERLREASRSADHQVSEIRMRQAERVQCTLLAMRERVAHQPADVVMNRVETALARLAGSPSTGRPLLSADPSGSTPVAFAFAMTADRPDVDSPPAPEADAVPTPSDPEPVVPLLEPDDSSPDHADLETAVALHRVLPVPAPVQAAARSKSRRRFGRSPVS